MKICMVGTGYVGLVTGACFASCGHTVYCVDVDENKINNLQEGRVEIYEPRLEDMVKDNLENGRLIFTTDLKLGVNSSDMVFIAVGTPQDEDGSADLRAVFQVCENICEIADKKVILATKSTVPVGTGDQIEELFQKKLKQPFVVFSNPEFLKEGDAVHDFMNPDRIVVGLNDESVKPLIEELYESFNHQENHLFFMDRRSAEITKYAANSMLALRISFMNELARFCDHMGANIHHVRMGIGSDSRIGPNFLYSGLGFGGSCFPKDVQALLRVATQEGLQLKTLEALQDINREQTSYFADKIFSSFGGLENLKGKKFAVWGLAFKARTDDIRHSPALKFVDILLDCGADVHVFDPKAMEKAKKLYEQKVSFHKNKMDCLENANALILATEWDEFKNPDFHEMKSRMKELKIFDGRNVYSRKHVEALGFEYHGVGV